jgi:hypothetical protein
MSPLLWRELWAILHEVQFRPWFYFNTSKGLSINHEVVLLLLIAVAERATVDGVVWFNLASQSPSRFFAGLHLSVTILVF